MARHLTLLIGFTATCGLAGCSRAPAPAPTPAPAPGATPVSETVTTTVDTAETPTSPGMPSETTPDSTRAGDNSAGFESPEAAFSAMQQALKDHDWRTAAECLTQESQESMTQAMLLVGGLMAAFGGDETAEIAAVFEKHGIEMEAPSFSFSISDSNTGPEPASEPPAEEMPEIADPAGFIADMLTALEGTEGGADEGLAQWTDGELTDLTIDGDTANATMVSQIDGAGEIEEIAFHRTGSGWLVHLGDGLFEMGPATGGPMVGEAGDDSPTEPLAEAILEDGLTSTIDLTFEQPFEQEFFGKDFPEGTLYVTLNLIGDVILDAYEYGQFQVVAAEDDTGTALELAAPVVNGFDQEFGEEYVELNDFFLDQKDTLPILFALTPPADSAEEIAALELSIKLKVRQSVLVKNVLASLGDTVEVEDVGEFTINKQDADNGNPDHGLQIEFKARGEAAVENMTLLDGEGQPLDTEGTFSFGFGSSKTFGISTAAKLPADTQMRISLGGSESIRVVPLTFEGLELQR